MYVYQQLLYIVGQVRKKCVKNIRILSCGIFLRMSVNYFTTGPPIGPWHYSIPVVYESCLQKPLANKYLRE